MVEIAKALYRKPRVLILDEPTSSLSAHETSTLTALLGQLRSEGMAILYISHRLDEVMRLCDHVTVLKDGTVTADRPMAGVTAGDLVRLMVGRDPGDLFPAWTPTPERTPIVSVAGFSSGAVRDVDLELRRGEVLGIGGLVGQGQEDLLLGLYGALPATARSASFNGADGLPGSVPRANALGLAYVPADRKREGLHLIHTIAWNLMLPSFARARGLSLRDRAKERATTSGLANHFAIRGDLTRQVQALSGGNQQKVALAKWMPSDPPILLLNDPTRGVDVETKREIYVLLRRFAAEGKAVLLSSSDTPELVHLCDRVVVVREGGSSRMLEGAGDQRGGDRRRGDGRRDGAGGGMSGTRRLPVPGSTGASSASGTAASARCSPSSSASSLSTPTCFPGFLSVGGISKFAQSWLPLALVSMAQAILMLTGGISLAIGALVSLGAVIAATTMAGPLGVPGGAAAVMLAGLGIGAVSGLIVVRLRLPAIIVTLAGSFIIGGAALLILPRPGGAIPGMVLRSPRRQHARRLRPHHRGGAAVEALSRDPARPQPLCRRREPGRRLSGRRQGRLGAGSRLCDQRSALHRGGPLRRRADRFRRPGDRQGLHAQLDRRRGARRRRLPRRSRHHARRGRRQPAAQRDDQCHVLPRLPARRPICRAGPDHHWRRGVAPLHARAEDRMSAAEDTHTLPAAAARLAPAQPAVPDRAHRGSGLDRRRRRSSPASAPSAICAICSNSRR